MSQELIVMTKEGDRWTVVPVEEVEDGSKTYFTSDAETRFSTARDAFKFGDHLSRAINEEFEVVQYEQIVG